MNVRTAALAQSTLLAVCKDALIELEKLDGSASIIKRLKIVLSDSVETNRYIPPNY
ncbi:hypothetical protein [Paenibacillus sp. Soil750]|uniref:hypothetical protein n=1 Tax=Paenibacillus sp. Soil750 TaxID=1736398 RepID=UPI000A579A01|nr:hypothetical protein [Paenibacillus sp. Soil750]